MDIYIVVKDLPKDMSTGDDELGTPLGFFTDSDSAEQAAGLLNQAEQALWLAHPVPGWETFAVTYSAKKRGAETSAEELFDKVWNKDSAPTPTIYNSSQEVDAEVRDFEFGDIDF